MRLLALALAAVVVAGPASAAEGPPLPKLGGKVGDFVVFKSTKMIEGKTTGRTVRSTLTELKDKVATVSSKLVVADFDPELIPAIPAHGIPVGVALDPSQLPDDVYSKLDAKPTRVTTAKETLTVAGKKLACDRVEMTVRRGAGDDAYDVVTKYWVCKDVPLTGLVKAEVAEKIPSLGEVKATYQLTEFGSK